MELYGGDLRIVRLAEMLAEENHTVFIYGHEKYFNEQTQYSNIKVCSNLDEVLKNSEDIISGMPISKDGITVTVPYSNEVIRLDILKEKLEGKQFIAGGIPEWFKENCEEKNIQIFDLLDCEELNVVNAIPTVEGTIKIVIEETPYTIHESNCLVLGYGRIGKILCDKLQALGANVYCTARKEEDFSWMREKRINSVKYNEIYKMCQNIDFIINTVPSVVIDEKIIKNLKRDCFIIELASKPGGVDKIKAEVYKVRVISAQGLPGKLAPLTAARYIKEIVIDKI